MDDSEKAEITAGFNKFLQKSLLKTLDEGTHFELDQRVITALDILPKFKADGSWTLDHNSNISSRTNTTVYAVLNKCRTSPGQKLLAVWLSNPLKYKDKIDTRLSIVQHLVENHQLRTTCYDDYLRKIPDMLRISFRISREKCSLLDLVKVYQTCKSAQSLSKIFHQMQLSGATEPQESVTKLFKCVELACNDLEEFMNLLDESIEMDNIDLSGDYMLKPKVDEDIARVTLLIQGLCDKARKEMLAAADEIDLEADKSIKLEADAEKGFAIRVTRANEALVRDHKSYYQVTTVKKDGFRFTSRALEKLSSKYVAAKEEYEQISKRVIEEIVSRVTIYEGEVLDLTMALTLIDVFVSLAVAAVQNNYTKPLILESGYEKIELDKMRHPCIENQPDVENYVPNDIAMSKDAKKFYLVTGPNMGGKSTFIRSVAINVLMAQSGSLIPAEDGRISIIDGVYTRIGAGDKQAEGISTFMEEMLDMADILKRATEHSLVIIDELGRGTSTFDGYGLAWSISKHLATAIRCYTIFATHFHELTEMEQEIDTVGNLHVKAVCYNDKLTMLYNVADGVCDESYGINVAKYTKFPSHVVDTAAKKLKMFEEVPGFESRKELRKFVRDCIQKLI